MPERVVFWTEAADDLQNARDWYEGKRVGLGEEFVRAVENRIRAIQRNPHIHAIVRQDYRRAIVRRFPYAIYYRGSEDTLTICAILHTSRSKRQVRRRLP